MKTLLVSSLVLGAGLLAGMPAWASDGPPMKVSTLVECADPGNLPMSDQNGQGYENKIAQVLGEALGASNVRFQWWHAEGHGMVRKTLGAGLCDFWMDMPTDTEGAITTKPLYRSAFVLVSPASKPVRVKTLADPILKKIRLGVFQTSTVREALSEHGVVANTVVHYISYDADTVPENQPSYQVQKVLDGKLDAAAVWGPDAGYYKVKKKEPVVIQPLNMMEDVFPLQVEMALAVNRQDSKLRDALNWAMEQKKDEIRKILDDYGVPLVQCDTCVISGDLPAHAPYPPTFPESYVKAATAAQNKGAGVTLDQLKQWLAQGADPTDELQDAILADDIVRVRYLMAHGAKPNRMDGNGETSLINATRFGYTDVAAYIATHGADVNKADSGGWTPLMYAAWKDGGKLVGVLAKQGAKIGTHDSRGQTALTIACEHGKGKAVAALIKAGANVDQTVLGGGYTPLMLAAIRGDDGIVSDLLGAGAKVDATNAGGLTALMIAADHSHPSVVVLLLKHGAGVNVRAADGRTALSLAKGNGDAEMVKLLKAHGAKAG